VTILARNRGGTRRAVGPEAGRRARVEQPIRALGGTQLGQIADRMDRMPDSDGPTRAHVLASRETTHDRSEQTAN
jgi:hypothetical protein